MPQVKYIATGIKTDSINGVGLRWEPGQVRNVTAGVAERLLAFPDTWEATGGAIESDELIGLAKDEKPAEEPLPVIDFHGMDKKALLEFAETRYNERLDKRQNEETLRHRVISLFTQREMEDEAK